MFHKTPVTDRIARAPRRSRGGKRRGATAVLAMLFLVILASLSLAMYAMATTNVQAARNFSDGDRARATAESGLRWTAWRFNRMQRPKTRIGNITPEVAEGMWPSIRTSIVNDYATLTHPAERKVTWDVNTETLSSAPIASDETSGRFTISIRQHPLYAGDPLDQRWLRVTSTGRYGNAARALSMDFKIDKKVKFAMVGRVPFQVGRNTLVEGPIGMATPGKYPPILMLSDFRHLASGLTTRANDFQAFLERSHFGYDGRINVNHPQELKRATDAGYSDYSRDGFIDEYDLFLKHFDRDGDRAITRQEFTKLDGTMYDPDLFKAIDSLGAPMTAGEAARLGYADDVIDNRDGYTKVRGTISLATTANAWEQNLASSGRDVAEFFQGPISPSEGGQLPVVFGVPGMEIFDLSPTNFDTTPFRDRTGPTAGTATKAGTVLTNMIVTAADANGGTASERTPFGSTSYQATYQRPVFKDMTFKDCRIPKGLNALFENCTFEGTTFVELTTNITNSSGSTTTSASEAMGWSRQMKSGSFSNTTVLTDKNSYGYVRGNNLRFNNCTIKGPIASDNPTAYSHFTNSWEFTGATKFDNLADATATIVAPQTNIEMGSFTDPSLAPSTLVGVVVAGNIDIRGSSVVDGSIIVTGDGAGNTTQGWFGPSDGSTTAGVMENGRYGRLNVRYNPNRPLPDGINLAIDIVADSNTYSEYVQQ